MMEAKLDLICKSMHIHDVVPRAHQKAADADESKEEPTPAGTVTRKDTDSDHAPPDAGVVAVAAPASGGVAVV
jgi:hypothetical protein